MDKKVKKRKEKFSLKNFIVIFLAGIINAIGVSLFLFPVKLYDSGISGLSMLLDQVTPPYLVLSIFLVVLNVPIFLFGYKKKGLTFTVYSIFAVTVYSIAAFLITNVLPIDVSVASPLAKDDLLLCAIFGGALSGMGSGFVIRYGGAIDGLDVLSVIFSKKLNISIGTFVLIFNYLLYTACGFVLSSWILPLYSMVTYFVASKTIDFIVDGFDRQRCAMIITSRPKSVMKKLNESFSSSEPLVETTGDDDGKRKKIIYFIVSRFEINKLKTIVARIDPKATVMMIDISEKIQKEEEVDFDILEAESPLDKDVVKANEEMQTLTETTDTTKPKEN